MNAAHHANEQEERRLFTTFNEKKRETYTGAEVVQSIYHIHHINADIQVRNQFFLKTLDIDETDISGINLQNVYEVTFIRDSAGTLKTIIFT
ncbi:hypothetical protein P4K96_22765 [Bacillus cereus]|nr:hypothetical protein [Bacillus cereus]